MREAVVVGTFIPGDDSGVQHSPGWADGGRQLRQRDAGKPAPYKNASRGARWGSIYNFKRQNVVIDTKFTLNPLGGGREKKKSGHFFPSITKYVFSKDDINLMSKA